MKKRISLLVTAAMLLTLYIPTTAQAGEKINVKINSNPVQMSAPPITEKGRTLVPADVFEKLGASTVWDEKAQTLCIEDAYTSIEFTLNSTTALVHRKYDFTGIPAKAVLDVAPRRIGTQVYIPLRFTAETLGAQVEWDGADSTVLIRTQRTTPVEYPVEYTLLQAEDIKKQTALVKWFDKNRTIQGIYRKTVRGTTYVLLSAGEKPTGGYTMEVGDVTRVAPRHIYITAKVIKPAPDMMVTQAITYPYLLLQLKASAVTTVSGTIDVYNYDQSQKDLKYELLTAGQIQQDAQLASWFEKYSQVKGIHYARSGKWVYVLASAGEKRTGGYTVDIANVVATRPDEAYVYAHVLSPDPDAMVTDALTYPYALLRIDSETIKHVGGDIKENPLSSMLRKDTGMPVSAADVLSMELYSLDQTKIKTFAVDEISTIIDAYNNAQVDDSPFIEMLAGNRMSITLKNDASIGITSYGSKTHIVAAEVVNGIYTTYHLACPGIASILLSK